MSKESSLMLAEAITAPMYAPLADKVGRRPVILVLLVFWSIGGFGFGLCQSVTQAILMRAWRELRE
jgi:MFS family permease